MRLARTAGLVLALGACGLTEPGPGPGPTQADAGLTDAGVAATDSGPGPYIARVVSFDAGRGAGYGADKLPEVIEGPPQGGGRSQGSTDVLSLGTYGVIVVELGVDVVDGPGPDLTVFETPAGVYTDLIVKLGAPTTGNVDFALTLKYLMDREQMRDAIWQGFATIGNDHPVTPSNRFFNPDIPQRKFDLERAKFHFQKSGVGNTQVPIVVSPAAAGSPPSCSTRLL